jgi:hypothetical protein
MISTGYYNYVPNFLRQRGHIQKGLHPKVLHGERRAAIIFLGGPFTTFMQLIISLCFSLCGE